MRKLMQRYCFFSNFQFFRVIFFAVIIEEHTLIMRYILFIRKLAYKGKLDILPEWMKKYSEVRIQEEP